MFSQIERRWQVISIDTIRMPGWRHKYRRIGTTLAWNGHGASCQRLAQLLDFGLERSAERGQVGAVHDDIAARLGPDNAGPRARLE